MKTLVNCYADFLEAQESGDEMGVILSECDKVINSSYSIEGNKVIGYNLPINIPYEVIYNNMKSYSRFPISSLIPVHEYKEVKCEKVPEEFSDIILTKEIMLDPDSTLEVNETDYLLGIDSEIDNNITAIGVKLLKTIHGDSR